MAFLLAIAALLISSASAECNNACSGNGYCTNYKAVAKTTPFQAIELQVAAGTVNTRGYDTNQEKKDSCTCFTHLGHNSKTVYQWTGADCSIRTCPHGPAFAGDTLRETSDYVTHSLTSSTHSLTDGGFHTQYEACSGQGTCTDKGKCECNPGYEGDACQRRKCPNDCSNAGKCLTLKQIAEDIKDANAYFYGDTFVSLTYDNAFDSEVTTGCVCDKGRHGPDCSLFDCPSGSDPMGGKGYLEGRSCSGRGNCLTSTGICKCYDGFFGTRCEYQRSQQV